MKKKSLRPRFTIALTHFYTFCMAKLGFMERDLDEFTNFGIDQTDMDTLRELLVAFADVPTDEELLGAQLNATQAKDALAEELRQAINRIMTRVENKFGFRSGTYRKFGINGVSKLDTSELSYSSMRVLRVARSIQPQLVDEGLTVEMLTDFEGLLDQYNNALSDQEDAIADRDIATELRIEKANEIYDLVAKYCETGKRIWEATNEAKYNDYIIYDTPSGSSPKETDG